MCPDVVGGNRGSGRHCVNRAGNLFLGEFYSLFELLLEPGRWVLDLLKHIDPSLKFELAGGDVVWPGAGESAATQWHQDWEVPRMIVAVSVLLKKITAADAPLWISTRQFQHPCLGDVGTILMRDFSVYHRGSVHEGEHARALPCFRFSTASSRASSLVHPVRASSTRNFAPHLRSSIHVRGAASDPATLMIANDDDAAEQ